MPIPASINDLSTTAGSNSPAGSESPALIDDYLRTYASYIAQLRDGALVNSSPLVGAASNLRMTVPTASATATVSADEIIVGVALGGPSYRLANFSKSINLATTGANAMDTGAAPVSGWVAIYAIYNPTTSTAALLGVNSPNSFMPTIYAGANMPAGYTASALLTVVPTNASSQFKVVAVFGKVVYIQLVAMFNSSAIITNTPFTIAGVVPYNAKRVFGELALSNTALSAMAVTVFSDTLQVGQSHKGLTIGAGQTVVDNYSSLPITIPQQIMATTGSSAGTPIFIIYAAGYAI